MKEALLPGGLDEGQRAWMRRFNYQLSPPWRRRAARQRRGAERKRRRRRSRLESDARSNHSLSKAGDSDDDKLGPSIAYKEELAKRGRSGEMENNPHTYEVQGITAGPRSSDGRW